MKRITINCPIEALASVLAVAHRFEVAIDYRSMPVEGWTKVTWTLDGDDAYKKLHEVREWANNYIAGLFALQLKKAPLTYPFAKVRDEKQVVK